MNRIYKLDNLKIFLIFFVVLGHMIDYYLGYNQHLKSLFIFIYSFHMPLFIFMTGLFAKKSNRIDYKKILYYFFIAIFMKITFFYISNLIKPATFKLFDFDCEWFLIVISIFLLLIPIINKINKYYLLIFSIILSLFVGYDASVNTYLNLSRIIVFFPFFLTGYYLSDYKDLLIRYTNYKWIKIISFLIIISFICLCIFKLDDIYRYRYLFTGKNPYSWVLIKNCNYRNRMITYCIQFIIGFAILSIMPNKKIKYITNFGTRTLQVYSLHMPIIVILSNINFINDFLLKYEYLLYIYCIFIPLALTIILSNRIIEKIFNHFRNNLFQKF